MFGLLDDVIDLGASVVKTAVSPVTTAIDILEGLTEGEFRTKAAIKLGVSSVAGLSIDEISIALDNL